MCSGSSHKPQHCRTTIIADTHELGGHIAGSGARGIASEITAGIGSDMREAT